MAYNRITSKGLRGLQYGKPHMITINTVSLSDFILTKARDQIVTV